jgi:hypothetical protein
MGGFWLNLDEINQLELELISTVISKINQIRDAIFQGKEVIFIEEGK